ncbi:MAG: hypothetical protein RLZZ08_385 [Pseudomonadota bacterium]
MIIEFLALALAPLPAAEVAVTPPADSAPAVAEQAVTSASPETVPADAPVPVPAEASVAASPVPAVDASVGVAATPPAADLPPEATGADIVVTGRQRVPGDPVAVINEQTYAVAQAVDGAVIAPIATTYAHAVPLPLRQGLHNLLNNLDEPIVFVNFLLQLKPLKAVRTVGRFAINTTLGIGGVMDVAKKRPFNLPRRSNGLADTLGYYGVGPGPFLYLPIIGSTTVRDLVARPFDLLILPAVLPAPFRDPSVALAKGTLNALDERVNFDEDLRRLREQSENPYAAVRDYYLTRRQAEIDYLRGKGPNVDDPDFEWKVKPAPSKHAAPPATAPETVPSPVPSATVPVEKVPAQ